jgi:HPt (histidine-containing phosphotransfer) domain-containing protein
MWHLPETLREFEEAGDDSLVLELIDSFQIDTASRLERLHAAVARFDAATVKAEAHSVRGSARQMGAEALAELCQAVESGAPKMNWPGLEDQVQQAEVRFAEALSAMAEYVNSKQRAGVPLPTGAHLEGSFLG